MLAESSLCRRTRTSGSVRDDAIGSQKGGKLAEGESSGKNGLPVTGVQGSGASSPVKSILTSGAPFQRTSSVTLRLNEISHQRLDRNVPRCPPGEISGTTVKVQPAPAGASGEGTEVNMRCQKFRTVCCAECAHQDPRPMSAKLRRCFIWRRSAHY